MRNIDITKILEAEKKASEAWLAAEATDCLDRKTVKAYNKAEKELHKLYTAAFKAGVISFGQYMKGSTPMCYRTRIL